jgi:hypothetical protein
MAIEASWMQNRKYSAREDRALIAGLYEEGVIDLTMLLVAESSPAAMTVDVSPGSFVIDGDDQFSPPQNSYFGQSDSVFTTPSIVPPSSNPRIDLVVMQVRDSDASGPAGDDVVILVLSGAENAAPTAPAVPDSALVLASISLLVGQTSILDSDITDLRVAGNRKPKVSVPGDILATGTPSALTFLRGNGSWGAAGDMFGANNLSELVDDSVARDNLGLGTAATTAATDYATTAQGDKADTAIQPDDFIHADLAGLAADDHPQYALAANATPSTEVQTFTASGTWTKPVGAKSVYVQVFGGGGGGGGGIPGGGGGGGGAVQSQYLNAAGLPASVTVTVGAGGQGTPPNIDLPGLSGGTSSFGPYIDSRLPAEGGTSSSSSAAKGGGLEAGLPGSQFTFGSVRNVTNSGNAEYGGAGSGVRGANSNGSEGGSSLFGGGGGGGGGNSQSAANVSRSGAAGGVSGSYVKGGANNGGGLGGNGFFGTSRSGTGLGGDGGGGGGVDYPTTGKNGGGGGIPGGGGGGGGGGDDVFNNGRGGNGGRGEVIVTTYF